MNTFKQYAFLGLLLVYIILGVISAWAGYWWRVGFVIGSPMAGLIAAHFNRERWPVMHPIYGFFFSFPALLALISGLAWPIIGALAQPVLEWGQWLTWSCVAAVGMTAAAAYAGRREYKPKGALFWTLAAFVVPVAVGLDTVNTLLPQGKARVAQVFVESTFAGGYRQVGPTVSLQPSEENDRILTYGVSWRVYRAASEGKVAICMCTFPGALGWRWVTLSTC